MDPILELNRGSLETPAPEKNPIVAACSYAADFVKQCFLGVFFAGVIAMAATHLSDLAILRQFGISPLIIAIVIGIVFGNLFKVVPAELQPGVQFTLKRILRLSIVLLGFSVTYQAIIAVGWPGLIVDFCILSSTLIFAWYIGTRVFLLDRDTSLLIGVGSSICGASAILAAEGVLRSDAAKTAIAVGTVTLFGTLAMFLYPVFYSSTLLGDIGQELYGVFVGSTVHEVAQVTAAGFAVGTTAGENAVVVKLARVMMLAPVLILLLILIQRRNPGSTNKGSLASTPVPWFVFGFIAVSGIYSLNIVPKETVAVIQQLDLFLLAMAMAALGVETKWSKIRQAGMKPVLLGLLLFVWLATSGGFLVYGIHWFGLA